MIEKLEALKTEALQSLEQAKGSDDLYQAKVKYFGKNGLISGLLRELGKLPPDQKKSVGLKATEVREVFDSTYSSRESKFKNAELSSKLEKERIDVTLPGRSLTTGTQHPIWMMTDEIAKIFARIGFSVRVGPHIERDFFNFDALNIPPDHASRDMQDTFYVEDGKARKPGDLNEWVLRTHTSPVQIRTMMAEKPPIRVIVPGGVYRSDSDMSHSPHFHQVEGLYIDTNVSMADLKGTLGFFARELFGPEIKVRLRPSYFPFVEPGAELDASCPLCAMKGCGMCKGTGWLELGGCGMVHPTVFKQAGMEYPKWNGFAFGMGVERMAVVKYGVSHLNLFFENDLRFLEQFRK